MATEPRRARRQRGSIDPDDILSGAFSVAQRVGLDNLSMPDLAAHLDVGVTSIYWYYRNKEDLLRRMSSHAARIVLEKSVGSEGYATADWRDFLRDHFAQERRTYAESDLLVDLSLMRTAFYSRNSTLAIYRSIEAAMDYLCRAGFSLRSAWYVFATMSIYTRGFVITERNRHENATPPAGDLQLGLLDPREMPLIAQLVVEESAIIDMTGDASFEFGLNLLIAAAEHTLESERKASD